MSERELIWKGGQYLLSKTLTSQSLIAQVWSECIPRRPKQTTTQKFEAPISKTDSIARGARLALTTGVFLGQRLGKMTLSVEEVLMLGIVLAVSFTETCAPSTPRTTFYHQKEDEKGWSSRGDATHDHGRSVVSRWAIPWPLLLQKALSLRKELLLRKVFQEYYSGRQTTSFEDTKLHVGYPQ